MPLCINTNTQELKQFDGDCPSGWTSEMPTGMVKPVWDEKAGQWIETATTDEIAEAQKQVKIAQVEMLRSKWNRDGREYAQALRTRITAELIGVKDAMSIITDLSKNVYPLVAKIEQGDWALAVADYLDGENNPTTSYGQALFDEIGRYAMNYYQNEYPHDDAEGKK